MSEQEDPVEDPTVREKVVAFYRVAGFRRRFFAAVVVLSFVAALLEGFGLSFILPIIELSQMEDGSPESGGLLGHFVELYRFLGIPFSMGYLITGVALIMTVRFTTSFVVGWLRAAIETKYVRHLQTRGFETALDAEIEYFDEEGSDRVLNAIVTQAEYAGRVIRFAIKVLELGLLSLMYFAIALYIAPVLTVITVTFLGAVALLFRNVVDPGYELGDNVAEAKERIQESAQAGTQGIRDVKLFRMTDELREQFRDAVGMFERSHIAIRRNQEGIQNFYQLVTAVAVFVLIYVALTFSSLSLGALGVFLFAMFRLGPKVSSLNKRYYRLEGQLPHLVRTQQFIRELEAYEEIDDGDSTLPAKISGVAFEDVSFRYDEDEQVLENVSFEVERGEFVAFAGSSGAGKSTIASLLARMYRPDEGEIVAARRPIREYPLDEWRSRVSIVRQDPHIFNDTLRRNVTIGKRNATDEEVQRVCKIAQVAEFLDDLPSGYETRLGDQGVKLSGGQRQRVAIARALLKDGDFLILDEATSDLDSGIEQEVHEGIEGMERDYAMIVIAHRLSTVTNADRIYTVEDGRIVESGSHGDLVSSEGRYAQLYSKQA